MSLLDGLKIFLSPAFLIEKAFTLWGGGGGGYFESYTMAGGGGGSGFIAAQVIHGQTYRGAREIPAMADDPDLPQSIDSYSGYAKYGWGGEIIINSSHYTTAGGGGGYCVIYY